MGRPEEARGAMPRRYGSPAAGRGADRLERLLYVSRAAPGLDTAEV